MTADPGRRLQILHVSTARGWRGGERQVLLLATGLARISHQLSTTAGDAPPSASFSRLGALDVLSSTPAHPSGRKQHCARHLADFATKPGEKCGLAQGSRDDRACAVTVAVPRASVLAERLRSAGTTVLPLPSPSLLHPGNLLRMVLYLRRHPGTIVHSHTSPALSIIAMARCWAPVTAVVHTRRVAFPVRRSSKYRSAADHYVAISQAVAAGLLETGLDPARLSVIPSAVDLETLDTAAGCPELGNGHRGPAVVCVGQLTAEKGHAVLLDAWRLVLGAFPEARLVLLGDGPEEPQLRRAAAALPDGSVHFAGFRNDVPAWHKGCDLAVQPSLSEGLGTAVLEAMACRLPVVASAAGGLVEVVEHGTTGLLVPPGDPQALAAALQQLLGDADLRATMGRAGRRRVEQYYSVETMVDRHGHLYRTLIAGQGDPE